MTASSIRRIAAVFISILVVMPISFCAQAEDDTLKYDFISMEGVHYRFDKRSGELEKMSISPDGVVWTKVPSRKSDQPATEDAPEPRVVKTRQPILTETTKGDASPKPPHLINTSDPKSQEPAIKIYDEKDEDITERITDDDRKAAATTITIYFNKLQLSQSLHVTDRIMGTIMVRNSGDKKLKALELTLTIPVAGRSKPEERRFLYLNAKGFVAPPQPGKDALPLMQNVDIPCPSGDVKGGLDLRVSYIQFAD